MVMYVNDCRLCKPRDDTPHCDTITADRGGRRAEDASHREAIGFVVSPFESCSRNAQTSLFAVLVGGIPRKRGLRAVKPEFRPHVRNRIVFERDNSAVSFRKIRKGQGGRRVDCFGMADRISHVVGERSDGEGKFIYVPSFS